MIKNLDVKTGQFATAMYQLFSTCLVLGKVIHFLMLDSFLLVRKCLF